MPTERQLSRFATVEGCRGLLIVYEEMGWVAIHRGECLVEVKITASNNR